MNPLRTFLDDVTLFEYPVFSDDRGSFAELFSSRHFRDTPQVFRQLNIVRSLAGVIRGLHWQVPPYEQGKLIFLIDGEIRDVSLCIDPSSEHFGRYVAITLMAGERMGLWIPPGHAHGYCAIEDSVLFYAATSPYSPEHERAIDPLDPELAIPWPFPITSKKDRAATSWKAYRGDVEVSPK